MILQAPDLAINKWFRDRGDVISLRQKMEQLIVYSLIEYLKFHGFYLYELYDGEESVSVVDTKNAMELAFNLDECSLSFIKVKDHQHNVQLIFGNGNDGLDVISDWSFSEDDADGFNKLMSNFSTDSILDYLNMSVDIRLVTKELG